MADITPISRAAAHINIGASTAPAMKDIPRQHRLGLSRPACSSASSVINPPRWRGTLAFNKRHHHPAPPSSRVSPQPPNQRPVLRTKLPAQTACAPAAPSRRRSVLALARSPPANGWCMPSYTCCSTAVRKASLLPSGNAPSPGSLRRLGHLAHRGAAQRQLRVERRASVEQGWVLEPSWGGAWGLLVDLTSNCQDSFWRFVRRAGWQSPARLAVALRLGQAAAGTPAVLGLQGSRRTPLAGVPVKQAARSQMSRVRVAHALQASAPRHPKVRAPASPGRRWRAAVGGCDTGRARDGKLCLPKAKRQRTKWHHLPPSGD